MEITFKTLTQETFKLELQPGDKISDVKERIAKDRGDAVDSQKLLYNGKVLADDSTVEQSGIDPTRFVVLMVTKKKAESPPSGDTKPAETSASTAPAAEAPPEVSPAAPATTPAPAAAPSEELTPEQTSALEALMSMGYPRDQSLLALQAAFFNADRAVDFLLGGIPEDVPPPAAAARPAPTDLAPGVLEAASGQRGAEGNAEIGLQALRNMPQFDEIRAMVRSNPDMLPELLQQIAVSNPELLQLISTNQNEFANMLNEIVAESGSEGEGNDDDDMSDYEEADALARPADQEEQLRRRGVTQITVSREEGAAIDRLKSMGFPEQLVIEAFFACDKNEDLAVNYILQRLDEAADALNE